MKNKKIFRVSKQRLTRCPQCARHIFLAPNWKETTCHFCDAHLLNRQKPILRTPATRSGLIAAGLLSASLGLAACDDTGDPGTDAMMMPAAEMGLQPAYGAVGPDMTTSTPDIGPEPVYGAVAVDMAPDSIAADAYGLPPEDASVIDAGIEPAPDAGVQPDYGKPAEPDDE